jgi:hypothetical protein
MTTRIKRTYNLSTVSVARVRELATSFGSPTSQDGVVEMAIERLYREVRDAEEAALWAQAAADGQFRSEMKDVAVAHRDLEDWPS